MYSLFYIIYNRTDCCKNRLDNYRVIISTESTNTYQADFAYAPNPKAIIDFGKQGKQGRYVKIQLLGVYVLQNSSKLLMVL
jgi:hypothetical protein